MRTPALLALTATLLVGTGCPPADDGSNPDWMKAPKSYQPKEAELTFNEKQLGEFNMMDEAAREAFVNSLKESKGSFKGQAMSKTGAALGAGMPDSKYGEYELNAVAEEVLFEISIDYHLFTTKDIGRKIAPNRYLTFSGTLLELDFQEESKPRRLVLKVATDTLETLAD